MLFCAINSNRRARGLQGQCRRSKRLILLQLSGDGAEQFVKGESQNSVTSRIRYWDSPTSGTAGGTGPAAANREAVRAARFNGRRRRIKGGGRLLAAKVPRQTGKGGGQPGWRCRNSMAFPELKTVETPFCFLDISSCLYQLWYARVIVVRGERGYILMPAPGRAE